MKATITKVIFMDSQYRVELECECGTCSAIWVGRTPHEGEIYHVELEVRATVTPGIELTTTAETQGLSLEHDSSALVGEITIADEVGYARLDFGCGGLDLEISDTQPLITGRYRLLTQHLLAFDCDY